MNKIKEYLKKRKEEVDSYIEIYFPERGDGPLSLRKAMRYSLLAGGKRIRPILAISTYEAVKKEMKKNEEIMPIAVSLEFIHTFTLIHDDLPALDNDDLRRGKPTNHRVFGEAMAILAGDALFIEAFNLLLKASLPSPSLVKIMKILAREIGINGVIGGQVVDIEAEKKRTCNEKQVQYIHEKKTASFIRASIEIGAIAGDADEKTLKILKDAGSKIGLAFQIVDDILDETSTPQELGKTPGKDRMSGKCTWVKVYGIDRAKEDAERLKNEAIKLLDLIPNTDILKGIAEFVVERTY